MIFLPDCLADGSVATLPWLLRAGGVTLAAHRARGVCVDVRVRVAALPSYGVFLVTSSIMLAEPLARRGKARWAKEESALEVSAGHPARHLPGANLEHSDHSGRRAA